MVTDFGIIKALDTKTALTRTGGTIGTPQYMSPEQIKAEKLDGRSGLYSLGIMMFNLLEGHVPFADETPFCSVHQTCYNKTAVIVREKQCFSTSNISPFTKRSQKKIQRCR